MSNWNKRYNIEKRSSTAELLGLLTPAAIVAQPFIMDRINKHNEKREQQELPSAISSDYIEPPENNEELPRPQMGFQPNKKK